MMKKTLLSIITVAVLASSTIVCAQPVDKNIPVTAEINGSISINKANGQPLDSIALEYNMFHMDGTYSYAEDVKIVSNTGAKVNVKLRNPLVLENDSSGEVKIFDDVLVRLGNVELNGSGHSYALDGNNEVNRKLNISAKKPAEALTGETYKGTLQLTIEDDI